MELNGLLDTYEVADVLGIRAGAVRGLANRGRLTKVGTKPRGTRFGRPRSLYAATEVEALRATRRPS